MRFGILGLGGRMGMVLGLVLRSWRVKGGVDILVEACLLRLVHRLANFKVLSFISSDSRPRQSSL